MDKGYFLNGGTPPPPLPYTMPGWGASDCVMNPNWDESIDHYTQFESARSSIVSSPGGGAASAVPDGFAIRELIGKLGTICSNTPSASTTPLGSPPMPNLGNSIPPPLPADPGFAERAAKFSCFGSRSFNGRTSNLGLQRNSELQYRSGAQLIGNGRLPRVSSSPVLKQVGSPPQIKNSGSIRPGNPFPPGHGAPANSNEVSSVSEQVSRKRKASRGKAKEDGVNANANKGAEDHNSSVKRSKSTEGDSSENGGNNSAGDDDQKQSKANQKPPEPPKDYIHVRARRGQATDSHSLAERVRREKISERMKLLQDLVPGCNKVTGKALMLDEIINYVQSLQRQVEFLSMKLATVNPRLDFNIDNLMPKDICQQNVSLPHPMCPLDSSPPNFHVMHHQIPQQHTHLDQLDSSLCCNLGMHLPSLDGFGESLSQFPALCDDDLQSVVQMGLNQNPIKDMTLHPQNFPVTSSYMKTEL